MTLIAIIAVLCSLILWMALDEAKNKTHEWENKYWNLYHSVDEPLYLAINSSWDKFAIKIHGDDVRVEKWDSVKKHWVESDDFEGLEYATSRGAVLWKGDPPKLVS